MSNATMLVLNRLTKEPRRGYIRMLLNYCNNRPLLIWSKSDYKGQITVLGKDFNFRLAAKASKTQIQKQNAKRRR